MKRYRLVLLGMLLAILLCPASMGLARNGQDDFNGEQMKRMGVFLSNFTEVGIYDLDASAFLSGKDPRELLHFGLRHNYVNAFNRTVRQCAIANCPHGSLVMNAADVARVYLRYLGKKPAKPVRCEEYAHFDGTLYHFEGADGEATYYAGVKSAKRLADGSILMQGQLYNAEEPSDILGTFTAVAVDHVWNGKPTWALLSLTSEMN